MEEVLTGCREKVVAEFKVVVIGDAGVGKTTFLSRFVTAEFGRKSIAGVSSVTFETNRGPIKLQIWNTACHQRLGSLREAYYVGANAAVIMFDFTSRLTYKNVPKWYNDLVRICENIPMVLLGNKVDQRTRKGKSHRVTFHRRRNMQYFDISALSGFQCEKPFIWILRALTGDVNLYLVETLALRPLMVEISLLQMQGLEQQWREADNKPLPADQSKNFP